MTTYHRIRVAGRTLYLRNMHTGERFIQGREVDKDGDRLDRFHIIEKAAVTRTTQMRIDLHYDTLVKDTNGGHT